MPRAEACHTFVCQRVVVVRLDLLGQQQVLGVDRGVALPPGDCVARRRARAPVADGARDAPNGPRLFATTQQSASAMAEAFIMMRTYHEHDRLVRAKPRENVLLVHSDNLRRLCGRESRVVVVNRNQIKVLRYAGDV